MQKKIAVLAGDGIGPEVMSQALKVLTKISEKFGHKFEFAEALVGGSAWDKFGKHLPEETIEICKSADAILFGSVGGPVPLQHLDKWKTCERDSILALRKTFGFFANLRPTIVVKALISLSPLRPEFIKDGIDLLIVRELAGDIYFGEHKRFLINNKRHATDLAEYNEDQIRAVAKVAFELAKTRHKKVTSVDKANVLDTSKLWREVVSEVAKDFPEIELEHMLVDNCAIQLVKNPAQFDVILTSNMFGDILSDQASAIPGTLGLSPSASLSAMTFNNSGSLFGLYEPSGGSAQDIAGKNLANPAAQILSAAMMLRTSFGLIEEAKIIELAVSSTIEAGYLTRDMSNSDSYLSTTEFTDKVISFI